VGTMDLDPGWYRLGDHGWERVADADAEAEIGAGGGWDLIHVSTVPVQAPLF